MTAPWNPEAFDERLAAFKQSLAEWNEAEAAVAAERIAMARDVRVMLDPRARLHPWLSPLNGETR